MAANGASCGLRLALACAAALSCASASPLGVSPRLDLPPSTSIGVAPRTRWVDERTAVRDAVLTEAAAAAPPAAIRATLEVVVPKPSSSSSPSTTASTVGDGDDGPPVFVGTDDAGPLARDDAAVLGDGGDGGQAKTGSKVFFVDEDSDEDAIKDHKTKKKDKKTDNVPIVLSYDGWKGKTEDDIPINPDRRRHYNGPFDYDMHHDYSGISAPAQYSSISPRPVYKTVRTNDVPVTFWDVPVGSETLLVQRLVTSPPMSNAIYPTPSPSYWRPTYVTGGPQWPRSPSNHYPGGYRSAIHKRPFQPTPSPGFYGSVQPRVYPSPASPGPTRRVWCPPRSPGWPSRYPLYPSTTSTTTTKPVLNVKDKLDLDDAEEDDKVDDVKKTPSHGNVKIIGKVELDDFRK